MASMEQLVEVAAAVVVAAVEVEVVELAVGSFEQVAVGIAAVAETVVVVAGILWFEAVVVSLGSFVVEQKADSLCSVVVDRFRRILLAVAQRGIAVAELAGNC